MTALVSSLPRCRVREYVVFLSHFSDTCHLLMKEFIVVEGECNSVLQMSEMKHGNDQRSLKVMCSSATKQGVAMGPSGSWWVGL